MNNICKMYQGKTLVTLTADEQQGYLREGDVCYIDGYVRGADDIPYAVCIRREDGVFGFMPIHGMVAVVDF